LKEAYIRKRKPIALRKYTSSQKLVNEIQTLRLSKVIDLVTFLLLILPKGQVLLEKFNDTLSITEVILFELVDLVKSILESAISELASGLVVLHDLVVEDWEVQGKTKLDWVAWGESNLVSLVVGNESLLLNILHKSALCVLGNVAIVITDHLDEEGLGFTFAWLGNNFLLDQVNDTLAISG
jgi:hypothetical protein